MHGDHELGARLRHSLLQERDRSQPLDARWLQALVGDLCQGDQRNLLPPLRHLVLSPVLLGELSRTPPLAEPRSRFRFREELRGVFTSPLCDRMEAVIDGLLDCPVSDGAIGPPPPPPPPSPGHSVPVPKVPPPRAPLASGPGELKQDPSIPAQLDGFAPPEAAPARPRNLWPVLLAGLLGGCLLPLAGLPLLQLIVRRSGPPHGPIGVVATGEPRDAAPGRSEQTSGSGSGAIDAGAESAAARPNPPLVTPPMAAPEPSGLPSAEPSPTDLNGDMGTAATPVAPQLPEAPEIGRAHV